jgi:RHS repeat-associated protein
LNGEDSLGLTYEKEIRTNGTTENKHYVSAGGMVFALFTSRTGTLNGLPVTTTSYFHKDHLGSIAAITDETGAVTERLAYDPWGKRRFINTTPGLTDKLDALVGIKTDRGYTEHEHLDEMGIINMNGRIFDPLIGRFMSADPFIQAPYNLKSFNRYSYVWNNPLVMFDPTGFETEGGLFGPLESVTLMTKSGEAVTESSSQESKAMLSSYSQFAHPQAIGAWSNLMAPFLTPTGEANANGGNFSLLDVAGKIWNLPNTAIGLLYGTTGYFVGWGSYGLGLQTHPPGVGFGDNAIQFSYNPFGYYGAITLGNVEVFGGSPNDLAADGNRIGLHEMQHTYQGQLLGPLYLPSNLLGGLAAVLSEGDWHAPQNWNEVGPQQHPSKPWPQ